VGNLGLTCLVRPSGVPSANMNTAFLTPVPATGKFHVGSVNSPTPRSASFGADAFTPLGAAFELPANSPAPKRENFEERDLQFDERGIPAIHVERDAQNVLAPVEEDDDDVSDLVINVGGIDLDEDEEDEEDAEDDEDDADEDEDDDEEDA
jgi:hypothetical protein